MKYLIIYILLSLTGMLQAQNYASRKLTEIGENFPKKCLPAADSIFTCPAILQGKLFIVKYNAKHEIKHLGVSLFSSETKEIINVPVCNFIERIMLELLLQKTAADVNKKLQEYEITLVEKGLSIGGNKPLTIQKTLDKLQPPVHFSLQQEASTYHAIWQLENGEEITLTFPASRELIFGTNKKESDQRLDRLLTESRCNKQKNVATIQKNELKPVPNSQNVYLRKGNIFIYPELNSDTYYTQDAAGNFNPVQSNNHPALFLKNLLLIPQLNTNLKLHIKHCLYGGFTPEFEMLLSDFICFFNQDFDVYFHIDDTEPKTLKVTGILYNKKYSYLHLLNITTPAGTLFEKNGVLQAEFFTNIPQHNIKNIFAEKDN